MEEQAEEKADFAAIGDEYITFAFDTVFIVRKTTNRPLDGLREYLGASATVWSSARMTNPSRSTSTPTPRATP